MRLVTVFLFLPLMLMMSLNSNAAGKKHYLPTVSPSIKAPDFELLDENNIKYKLSDFRGKVVVINFWATWCPPCRYEMPALERLWNKVKDKNIVILAINVGENADAMFEFTGEFNLTMPIPMDINGEVVKKYPVTGLPTTYIINPQGYVTHRAMGGREWDSAEIVKQLQQLLKPK